jgi:hypothetical protein
MGIPSGRLHVAEIQERQMGEKRFVLEIHGNNERKLFWSFLWVFLVLKFSNFLR